MLGTDRANRGLTILRALFHEVRVERITFMAGSLAYHAFVSLLPLLLLLLGVFSTIGGGPFEESIIEFTEMVLTPGASEILVTELRRASATPGVSLVGLALLIWGTLRIFRGLDTAFSDIYETGSANTFRDRLRDGFLVFVAMALAVAVGAYVEVKVIGDAGVPGGWPVERLLLVGGLGLTLFPMYYVFPDYESLPAREVLPGLAFAAVSLTAFESVYSVYIEVSSRSPRRSALIGILVFLTWLYVSGLVILLGAVLNAVLTNRSADVDIDPVIGGRPAVTDVTETDGLVERLRDLETRLEDADSIVLHVDDERFTLPPPQGVATDDSSSKLLFVDDPAALRVWWSDRDAERYPGPATEDS